jgi:hypothetical protein
VSMLCSSLLSKSQGYLGMARLRSSVHKLSRELPMFLPSFQNIQRPSRCPSLFPSLQWKRSWLFPALVSKTCLKTYHVPLSLSKVRGDYDMFPSSLEKLSRDACHVSPLFFFSNPKTWGGLICSSLRLGKGT